MFLCFCKSFLFSLNLFICSFTLRFDAHRSLRIYVYKPFEIWGAKRGRLFCLRLGLTIRRWIKGSQGAARDRQQGVPASARAKPGRRLTRAPLQLAQSEGSVTSWLWAKTSIWQTQPSDEPPQKTRTAFHSLWVQYSQSPLNTHRHFPNSASGLILSMTLY